MRVLIVDDHTLVRAGLSRLLQTFAGVDVVAEASNADQAIDLAAIHRPDLVLLDLSLPGRTGLEALSGILERAPGTRVVMMSMHDDPLHVRDALDRGAAGFVVDPIQIESVDLVRGLDAPSGLGVHVRGVVGDGCSELLPIRQLREGSTVTITLH